MLSVVFAWLAACTPKQPAAAPAEPPAPPYPAALARDVKLYLPFCRAGSIDACDTLGNKLLAAGYVREASSAYSYACYVPPEAAISHECKPHVDGSCAACDRAGQPGCAAEPWMCEADMRDFRCGDGSYVRCARRQQLASCRRASSRLNSWALKHGDDGEETCSDRYMRTQEQSLAFAEAGCHSADDSTMIARWLKWDGGGERCEQYDARRSMLRECADYRRDMAAADAQMAASRAQFQRDFARAFAAGVGDIAGTARQLDAAKRGEIVAHERVELPAIDPSSIPVTKEAIGAALTEHAPEILRTIARLHPEGDRIFSESTRALERLRQAAGAIEPATGLPPAPQ